MQISEAFEPKSLEIADTYQHLVIYSSALFRNLVYPVSSTQDYFNVENDVDKNLYCALDNHRSVNSGL